MSAGSVRLSERRVFIPRVLVPERGFGLSWWENPAVRLLLLQGVLGNVVRIIWEGGRKSDEAQSEKKSENLPYSAGKCRASD